MLSSDAATEFWVVGIDAVAMEGAAGLYFDGEADVTPEVKSLALEVMAPVCEELTDAADGLLADGLARGHVREVPERIAEVEENGRDARGHQ